MTEDAARYRLDIEKSLQNLTLEDSENQSLNQSSIQTAETFSKSS